MDFQEIYTEFQPRILHYLSRMMGREEAEDVTQEVFENVKVRLHRARARLKKELENGCDFYHNEEGALACDRKPIAIMPEKPDEL